MDTESYLYRVEPGGRRDLDVVLGHSSRVALGLLMGTALIGCCSYPTSPQTFVTVPANSSQLAIDPYGQSTPIGDSEWIVQGSEGAFRAEPIDGFDSGGTEDESVIVTHPIERETDWIGTIGSEFNRIIEPMRKPRIDAVVEGAVVPESGAFQ